MKAMKLMGAAAFSVLWAASIGNGWVSLGVYWTKNPGFYINNSNPDNLRSIMTPAAYTWRLSGGAKYPFMNGSVTGRDCGAGDSWFSDDDDGYNVLDYWDHCNSNSWYSGSICGGPGTVNNRGFTYHVDLYNGTSEVAETDIVMCNNVSWTTAYNYANDGKSTYQGWLTHEFGHAMGIDHSNVTSPTPTMSGSMSALEAFTGQSLSGDDVTALRSKYGTCSAGNWTFNNQGQTSSSFVSATGCGVDLRVYPTPTNPAQWTARPISAVNIDLGGWVRPETRVRWDQYDRDHSLIIRLSVLGNDGVWRELDYAKNAPNWWPNVGWVDMSPNVYVYNTWWSADRNINSDYSAEYGVGAKQVGGIVVEHFVYTGWTNANHGGIVTNLRVER